jgi:hypothetical protein
MVKIHKLKQQVKFYNPGLALSSCEQPVPGDVQFNTEKMSRNLLCVLSLIQISENLLSFR